jgi:hypothetical protein
MLQIKNELTGKSVYTFEMFLYLYVEQLQIA